MALKDWAGLAGQAANAWQLRENYDDAQNAIDKGFEQARTDVQQYQVPYTNFGLEHMQGYNNMGEFSFSNEDFYRDPSYQWRMDQGMENTLRQQAAAKQVGSGQTLRRLTELGQNMASQEYQAAFDRAQGTYDTNRAYHQFGVETGAGMAKELGTNLAELGIGKAGATASLHASLAEGQSRIISSTLANMGGGDPGSISGIIGDAIDTFGGLTSGAIDMISSATGLDTGSIMSAVKGAGATVLNETAGAAWGMFGAGPQTLGGAGGAASGASGAGAASGAGGVGLGATLVAASPLLAFGGIIALNEMLGSDPKIGKTINKVTSSQDPIGTIQGLEGRDTSGLWARDGAIGLGESSFIGGEGRVDAKLPWLNPAGGGSADKGALYGMVLNSLPPEAVLQYRSDERIGTMSTDMLKAISLGREERNKYTGGNIGSATQALSTMYPELAGDFERLRHLSTSVRRGVDWANTSENGESFAPFEETARQRDALIRELQQKMATYQGQWERRSNIEKEVGDL